MFSNNKYNMVNLKKYIGTYVHHRNLLPDVNIDYSTLYIHTNYYSIINDVINKYLY